MVFVDIWSKTVLDSSFFVNFMAVAKVYQNMKFARELKDYEYFLCLYTKGRSVSFNSKFLLVIEGDLQQ